MTWHWHVLGAGAMGCLFASALTRARCTTTLLLRDATATDAVDLTIEEDGNSRQHRLKANYSGDQGYIAQLLVTTKAYDVLPAVSAVRHRLDRHSRVLLMVNGMGFGEQLQAQLPWLDTYQGTTTEGAFRIAPWHICHAGRGHTVIGRQGMASPPQWFNSWQAALDQCAWDADIDRALWRKLAVNCAINPLTALHSCRNGELASNPDLASQVTVLCREIARVCAAAGFQDIARDVATTVATVIRGTADNRSSMLQDVLQGRRTEIDYITGYLLAEAQRHGIDVPLNTRLYEGVKDLAR